MGKLTILPISDATAKAWSKPIAFSVPDLRQSTKPTDAGTASPQKPSEPASVQSSRKPKSPPERPIKLVP